jgi:hypothetical protein
VNVAKPASKPKPKLKLVGFNRLTGALVHVREEPVAEEEEKKQVKANG